MHAANNLKQFLRNHTYSNENNQNITHTRIGSKDKKIAGGSYTILDEDKSTFWNLYHKHVFEEGNHEYLTESQLQNGEGPILIDMDFRFNMDVQERQHNDDDIRQICEIYVEKISEIKDFNSINECSFPIYVFQKPDVNTKCNDEGITKDGIHIIIGIKMNHQEQIILRNNVIPEIAEVFQDMPLINKMDDILDRGITSGSNKWQVIGSRKPGHQRYELTNIFMYKYKKEHEEFVYNITVEEHEISEFNLSKNIHKLSAQYSDHISIETKDTIKSQCSQVSLKKKTTRKFKVVNNTATTIDYKDITSKQILEEQVELWISNLTDTEYKYKELYDYTMALPESYYGPGSYNNWIRVGWAIKNTNERLFIIWLAFSAQSCNFDYTTGVDELLNRWTQFTISDDDTKNLTHASIKYWCKLENPTKYSEILNKSVNYYIEETIKSEGSDYDIAVVLHKLYNGKFVCTNISKRIWYKFDGHRWKENDKGTDLRNLISTELYKIYLGLIQMYVKKLSSLESTSEDEAELSEYRKKINVSAKQATVITKSLKDKSKKDKLMEECVHLFYDPDFEEMVDNNKKLIGFDNGVIDFNTKTFREGRPEDYISRSTKNNYLTRNEIENFDTKKNEIEDFMKKLFPKEELCNYMWDHLASTLIGGNINQTFNIYNGNGSNGKSLLVKLMEKSLGDGTKGGYKGSVPNSLITQKRNSVGSTSSEIAQLKGVRYAVIQEPSQGDVLNEGILKELTGGDPITARGLYKDSITFEPHFKLVVCTNNLFDINSTEDGTWRRIKITRFESKFVDNPVDDDPDEPYQFLKDRTLEDKLDGWVPVFMNMLVERAYNTDGIVHDCLAVTEISDSYRNDQDYINNFMKEKLKMDPEGCVGKRTISECFKQWYSTTYSKTPPSCKALHERMEKKFGKYTKRGWKGVNIILEEDDDDEEE